MSLAFAFKITSGWSGHESILEYELDKAISAFTGSPYCHVEAWIGGGPASAQCYSSRNPGGTSIQTIDLTGPGLWKIVGVSTTALEDEAVWGFCIGCSGRRYDEFGLLGIGLDTTVHDPYDRQCSETCFEIVSEVLQRPFDPVIKRWMVAPGCPVPVPAKRYGLFELLEQL